MGAELTQAETIAERLSALITPKRPLTVDEILMMSICIMLPSSFKPTVTPLLQRDTVTSSQVISAIQEELIVNDIKPVIETAAVAVDKKNNSERRHDDDRRGGGYCHFCRKSGHTKENCTRIEKKNKEKEEFEKMKAELAEIRSSLTKSKSTRTEKASVANQVPISPHSSDDEMTTPSDSDFSYSANHTSHTTVLADPVVDSGCSIHMYPSSAEFSKLSRDCTEVRLADGSVIKSTEKGQIEPGFTDKTSQSAVVVPQLTEPLLSVSKLSDDGIVTIFDKSTVLFYRKPNISGKLIGRGVRRGGLYYLPKVRSTLSCKQANVTEDDVLLLWHRRLNHPCIQVLKRALKKAGVDVSGCSEGGVRGCRTCLQGKMRRRNLHSRSAFLNHTLGCIGIPYDGS